MANNNNRGSGLPTARQDAELNGTDFVGETIGSLKEIADLGIPRTDAELESRINTFFEFCGTHNIRPGIETLSMALGCDRRTFWTWCRGLGGKSDDWGQMCRQARQLIISFTEQAMITNHLTPPVAIFTMKNLASWKDTVSFEELSRTEPEEKTRMSAKDLPRLMEEMGITAETAQTDDEKAYFERFNGGNKND